MKKQLQKLMLSAAALTFSANVFAAVGGPDSYGYTFTDSNEPSGPVYSWIEIAPPAGGSGTLSTTLQCDDCHEAGIQLGFTFPFYGTYFDSITIASNGTIYFEDVYLGLSNICMPGTPGYSMTQFNFIAHLWNDLDPSSQGGIYYQSFGNYMVIEYYDIVPCCGTGDGDSWQIILYDNGNILFQYQELSNVGISGSNTIGIQNDPTTGLQYVCDATGNAPANGLAVLFERPAMTGVNSISAENMSIYPNPSNGIVTINCENMVNANIEVFNSLGEIVFQNQVTGNQSQVDLTEQPNGVYVIQVKSEGIISTKRVTLQH